jgi:DNA-binding YbaB/EbfC family protein
MSAGDDDFMGNLLKQAQAMQEQMLAAQANAAAQEVEGQAGGGRVKITATGGMEFTSVRIDPSVVDPTEIELLEDLILAALHDAVARAQELQSQALGPLANLGGGLGGLLPGGEPG